LADGGGLVVELHDDGPIPLAASLACRPGELVALVGPSGSGKSTILRSIAGIYHPMNGFVSVDAEVWLDDRAGIDVPPHRRAVGLVFQSYALFPHLTALRNVMAALDHLERGEREARARALLAQVHLTGLEDRRPGELSGGQQQRVAVARALAREPRVLLLDEPFSAVDRPTRRKLQRELAELRRSVRIPIVLVTHDLEEALALADRMVALSRGRTLQEGPPGELVAHPTTVEVARLLDLRNVFEATVTGHSVEARVTHLRWRGGTLMAPHAPALAQGTSVWWFVEPTRVRLSDASDPSPNSVRGTVADLTVFRGRAHGALLLDAATGDTLGFSVLAEEAEAHGLATGEQAQMVLPIAGIHVMLG
jgi:molybdate transport system ATP-binding protein